MDRPDSGAVCKSNLDLENAMEKIYKTFSDVLEGCEVKKYNHNHDKLGRFSTSNGSSAYHPQSKAYFKEIKAKGVDLKETKDKSGNVNGWNVKIGKETVHVGKLRKTDGDYTKIVSDILARELFKAGDEAAYGSKSEKKKYRGCSADNLYDISYEISHNDFRKVSETYDKNGDISGWDVKVNSKTTLHYDVPDQADKEYAHYVCGTVASKLNDQMSNDAFSDFKNTAMLWDKHGDTPKFDEEADKHSKKKAEERGYTGEEIANTVDTLNDIFLTYSEEYYSELVWE